jgi:predicted HTH domain antitoxin
MSITIELPDPIEQELTTAWGISSGELPRRVLELVAAEGYRKGALSHHEVSQLLNLGFSETEAFLKSQNCPSEYSLQDLEDDRQTLEAVLGA